MRRNTDSAVPLKLRPKPPLLRALMRRTHPAFTGSSRAEIQRQTLPRYFHRQPLSDGDEALLTAPPCGTRSSPFWYPIRVNITYMVTDCNPQSKTFAAGSVGSLHGVGPDGSANLPLPPSLPAPSAEEIAGGTPEDLFQLRFQDRCFHHKALPGHFFAVSSVFRNTTNRWYRYSVTKFTTMVSASTRYSFHRKPSPVSTAVHQVERGANTT